MKVILHTLLLLICSYASLRAQNTDSASLNIVNAFLEAHRGEKVNIQLYKKGTNTSISMKNAPKGAILDDSLNFSWQIPDSYFSPSASANFYLYQDDQLVDVQTLFIRVIHQAAPPTININCEIQLDNGIYIISPNETLQLSASAYSQFGTDSSQVELSYFLDGDPNLTDLENAEIILKKNELKLNWTPSEDQLEKKYFRLTLEAKDQLGQLTEQVLLFVLYRNNTPPYFKYPVLEEYYIAENELLSIDLSARDRESDSLIYKLNIPSKIGNPKLSSSGIFSWKINQDQIKRLRAYFPMEISVDVTEIAREKPHTITKTFILRKSIRNEPPKILNLQNETIKEGLTINKRVFIQDGNDKFSELDIDIIGAPEGMTWQFDQNLLSINWTPNYDIVGVEKQPKKFDMLLVVHDPYGFVDQKAFTITVQHRENTEITFDHYLQYREDLTTLVENLSQMHSELEVREARVTQLKKSLSLATMLFAVYTATGNVFEDGSLAKEMVPYVGIMAAVAGGINAFGFNDLPSFRTIREQSFILQQKLIYILAILDEYNIESKNSHNLENVEFRERLNSYQQSMVQDKLNFKSYYIRFKNLNYNQRAIKTEKRKALQTGTNPQGLLFIDLSQI